jgi:acetolactate synthase I/II/III large subunit
MKASDHLAHFLVRRGVTMVFEMVGGMITHLLDSMAKCPEIRIISMHHEQGAAFAVDGYSRVAGIPSVAMATSGPGATNLLTGIGSCYFDSVPSVFITGQVNRHEMKRDRAVRQLGFQETDIVTMAKPITKAAWLVEDPAELPAILERAFDLAVSGRPGPVLIDLPMDVQRADIPDPAGTRPRSNPAAVDPGVVAEVWKRMAAAQRPVILAGGGIRSGRVVEGFRQLIERVGLPVVNSLMAVDALPMGHPLRVGLIGSYGNRWANIALGEADAVLVLGSRLDIRQTGSDTGSFAKGKSIIHVDCDAGETNNRIQGCHSVHADLGAFINGSLADAGVGGETPPSGWLSRIEEKRREFPDIDEIRDCPEINPNVFMHALSSVSNHAAGYVIDVGQHQMWAAQSLDPAPAQFFITSGGMGAMGFALPAAIGAAFASSSPVIMIAGDGGFQLNIQELQTVIRNRLPIKMIVINNRCHGMVRQFQESYFDGRYQSTVVGYSAPDFAAVAKAYGIESCQVKRRVDLDAALQWLWRDPSSPSLLEVAIGTDLNVYPKIAFGKPITEMEPFAKPIEMEGT